MANTLESSRQAVFDHIKARQAAKQAALTAEASGSDPAMERTAASGAAMDDKSGAAGHSVETAGEPPCEAARDAVTEYDPEESAERPPECSSERSPEREPTHAAAPEQDQASVSERAQACSKEPDPARPVRHNEWTSSKRATFLRELAACQSVAAAARAVGMSRPSAYKLRNRLQGTPFALGWEVALESGYHQLGQAVMDRALNGVEVPHYHRGELVGTTVKHDNALARWVLDNPLKVGRQQIEREYSAEGFDLLLERIEWGGPDWEAGESLPTRGEHEGVRAVGQQRERDFMEKRSWYAAEAARTAKDRR